jgi:hypothetical protein
MQYIAVPIAMDSYRGILLLWSRLQQNMQQPLCIVLEALSGFVLVAKNTPEVNKGSHFIAPIDTLLDCMPV